MTALSIGVSEAGLGHGRGPGRLLCIGGRAGSGKTTLGRWVAAEVGAALLDLDSLTTPLLEEAARQIGFPADFDAPPLSDLRDARYACLAAAAADNLAGGIDVVAVAPFTREARNPATWRDWGTGAAGAHAMLACWLTLDAEVANARAAARGLPRDRAKTQSAGSAVNSVDGAGADVRLDATLPVAETVARVIALWGPTRR